MTITSSELASTFFWTSLKVLIVENTYHTTSFWNITIQWTSYVDLTEKNFREFCHFPDIFLPRIFCQIIIGSPPNSNVPEGCSVHMFLLNTQRKGTIVCMMLGSWEFYFLDFSACNDFRPSTIRFHIKLTRSRSDKTVNVWNSISFFSGTSLK